MTVKEAFESFREIEAKIHALSHAMGVMSYDAATGAPVAGAENRGNTMAFLSGLEYDLTAGEETIKLARFLQENNSELSYREAREVSEFMKSIDYVSSIPKEEYQEYIFLLNEADGVWKKAKAENDYASFCPYVQKIFDTNRRFAQYYKPDKNPYDVMLDMYERGLTMEVADKFFETLREKLVPVIKAIGEKQQFDFSFMHENYPIYKQRELSDYLMQVMAIDRDRCAIGETEHPFTTNFCPDDVRITTHYHDDFTSSMYSVIHEGGHALYELGVSNDLTATTLAGGVSMGIHESQSRLFENNIGRSEAFCNLIFPEMQKLFPEQLRDVTAHDFYLAINKSEPSLIRTEADELTYALHVMVRYELEKKMISGELTAEDLPAAWNAKYKEYLGVDVPDDTHGVLQDSHWSGGAVGYFPSYALGSAYSAQIMAKMREEIDVDAEIASGSLKNINAWLGEHIYQYGCLYDPAVLLEKCVGAPFDPNYYVDYLTEKYKAIYGLDI